MVAWRTCVVRPVHDVKLEAQDGRVGVEEDVHLVRGVLRVLPAVPHAVRVVQLGRGHAIQLEERVRVKNRFESDKREGSQPPGRTGKEFRARTSAALTRELLPHGASIETFDWALHQHQAASHARATRQRSEGGVHRRVWKRSATFHFAPAPGSRSRARLRSAATHQVNKSPYVNAQAALTDHR